MAVGRRGKDDRKQNTLALLGQCDFRKLLSHLFAVFNAIPSLHSIAL